MYEYGTLAARTPCHVDAVGTDWSLHPAGPRPPAPTFTGVATGSPAWFLAMALDHEDEDPQDYDLTGWGEELRERINRHLAPDLEWGVDHVFRSPAGLEEQEADRRIHAALRQVCPACYEVEGDHRSGMGQRFDPAGRAMDRFDLLRYPVSPKQIQALWSGAVAYIDQGPERYVLTRREMNGYFLPEQIDAWGTEMPQEEAVWFARLWSASWIDITEVASSDYDDPDSVRVRRATEDVRNGAALPGAAHRSGLSIEEVAAIRQQWLTELDQAQETNRVG